MSDLAHLHIAINHTPVILVPAALVIIAVGARCLTYLSVDTSQFQEPGR
jgi:hypothetical protein